VDSSRRGLLSQHLFLATDESREKKLIPGILSVISFVSHTCVRFARMFLITIQFILGLLFHTSIHKWNAYSVAAIRGFLIFFMEIRSGKIMKYKSLKVFVAVWLKKPFFRNTTPHQLVIRFLNFDAKQ
jgi:hypothetical protein